MKNFKHQFFIVLGVWFLGLLATVFWLGPALVGSQVRISGEALLARKNLAEQLAQEEALRLAEESLNLVSRQSLRPQELLLTESSLVSRLALLESWAKTLNLELKSKFTGTVEKAERASTRTDIAVIPTTLILRGSLPQVLSFLPLLEQSFFSLITDRVALSVDGSADDGGVLLTLEGNVYVQR